MGLQGDWIHHGGSLVINLQWFARVSRLSNSFSGAQKRRTKRDRGGFAACHRRHRSAAGKGRVFFSNVGRMSCPKNPSEVFVCGIGQQISEIRRRWGDRETPRPWRHSRMHFLTLCLSLFLSAVAPDAIHHHVKTCRDNMKNMHFIAPEYGGKCALHSAWIVQYTVCVSLNTSHMIYVETEICCSGCRS